MKPTSPPPFSEDELHAWVDGHLDAGQLDAGRRAELEAWLAAEPERAAELARWRRLNARLHAAYDPILAEAIPARLLAAAARPRKRLVPLRAAAALVWITLGGLLGLGAGYQLGSDAVAQRSAGDAARQAIAAGPALPRQAALAHAVYAPEQRHPVEVGADDEAHLVAWLSKRLGRPLSIPDLSAHAFRLIGGRLLATAAGPGAQFMYENAAGQRLTLYVTVDATAAAGTAFRYAREDGIGVFYWVDRELAYALSGALEREALLPAAQTIYRQLTP